MVLVKHCNAKKIKLELKSKYLILQLNKCLKTHVLMKWLIVKIRSLLVFIMDCFIDLLTQLKLTGIKLALYNGIAVLVAFFSFSPGICGASCLISQFSLWPGIDFRLHQCY